MKQIILDTVEDVVKNLLYYDRKHDEDLKLGMIELAIENGKITIDEIVAKFKAELEKEIT